MFIIPKHKVFRVLIHFLAWSLMCFVLFMYPPMASKQVKLPDDFVIKQTTHMLWMIIAYYFNAYYLTPQLLLKNKRLLYFTGVLSVIFLSSFTLAIIDGWLKISEQLEPILGRKMWANPYIDFFGLLTTLFVLGISTSTSVVQKWNLDNIARQDFEKQKIVSELSFLKAQINPHFFFNTLNSIYALTYVNVENSRKVIYKLSRMMRYVLDETQQHKVPLKEELSFISDYVEIMRLRTKANMKIDFTAPEVDEHLSIAPMLLLPYIENAFKHGVDDVNEGTISIKIQVHDATLKLEVQNMVVLNASGYHHTEKSGIGMTNTKRRLELLYADKHNLDFGIDASGKHYYLQLALDLK